MRYTLQHGYDSQLRQRLERGALYAVPLAIIGMVGFASLTSNSTTGGGVGSPSRGKGGTGSIATTFSGSGGSNDQQLVSSTVGNTMQSSTTSGTSHKSTSSTSGSSATASNPVGGSVTITPGGDMPPVITVPTDPIDPVITDPGTGGDGGSTPVIDLPVIVDTPVGGLNVDLGVDTSGNGLLGL